MEKRESFKRKPPMKKSDKYYQSLKLLDKIITRDIIKEDLGILDITKKYKISVEELSKIRELLVDEGINKMERTYNF